MSVAGIVAARVQELVKLRCHLFGNIWDPTNARTGSKILRQRLVGPALAAYYPRRAARQRDLELLFPELETLDEDESDRLDSLALKKARGKEKPKKKRTAEESKKFAKRKPLQADPKK